MRAAEAPTAGLTLRFRGGVPAARAVPAERPEGAGNGRRFTEARGDISNLAPGHRLDLIRAAAGNIGDAAVRAVWDFPAKPYDWQKNGL